LFVKLA